MANVPIESFGNVVPDDLARVLVVDGLSGPIIGTSLLPKNADRIAFDNVASGLTATEVQAAIDEIVAGLGTASAQDYEEGTFTSTFTFSIPGDLSIAYGSQAGKYVKIGKVVSVAFSLGWTPTYTTASGFARFGGLPFACDSGTKYPFMPRLSVALGSGYTWPFFNVENGQTYCQGFKNNPTTGAGAGITTVEFPSGVVQTAQMATVYNAA